MSEEVKQAPQYAAVLEIQTKEGAAVLTFEVLDSMEVAKLTPWGDIAVTLRGRSALYANKEIPMKAPPAPFKKRWWQR